MGTNPDSDAPATHESRCVAYLETAIDRELAALATTGDYSNNALNATAFAGAEDGVSVTDLRARLEGTGLELHAEKRDSKHAPPLDREAARRFLTIVDPTTDRFTFQTFDDVEVIGPDGKKKRRQPELAKTLHGALDEHWDELCRLNRLGAGIFVTVNATKLKGRRIKENIAHTRGIWSDNDGGRPASDYPLAPSLMVQSSPGKSQDYWLFANGETLSPDFHGAVMERMIEDYGADKDAKDLVRVLRLPGFHHLKNPNQPFQVRIIEASGKRYTRAEILRAFPPLVKAPEMPKTSGGARLNGKAGTINEHGPARSEIEAALSQIPAHDRTTWRDVGMALHDWSQGSAEGREVWDKWSRTARDKYDEGDQERTWRSFKPGGGITIPTVFWLAQQHGANLSALARQRRGKSRARKPVETVDPVTGEVPGKPQIRIAGGDLAPMADQAERHLIEAGALIFQRGGKLVRPVVQPVPDGRGNTTNDVHLVPVTETYLRDMLCRTIDWFKFDNRRKEGHEWKSVDAPKEIARVLLDRQGEWEFAAISGVISIPTLRHDGSLLDKPGYDEKTGLYLASDVKLPAMPDNPTRDHALSALAKLKALLDEVAFVDDGGASRSVALSATLTAVVRGMLNAAPAHGATASTRGTGKSYMFDTVSAIVLGTYCPVIAASSDPIETEKRIITRAMTGAPLINIDNINGKLESNALCQLISQPICELRVLGKTEDVKVTNRATIFFNGNNVQVAADLTRRVLLARLETLMENPEERVFKNKPVEEVLVNRGDYIAACLTVVRAYIVAGRPRQSMTPMSGFDEWSNTVRAALLWLGEADPCATIEAVREDDPEKQKLEAFIAAAKPHLDGVRWSKPARDIIALAQQYCPAIHPNPPEPQHPDLHAVVMEFARGTTVSPGTLAGWLRRMRGRVVKGMRISSTKDSHSNVERWYIAEVKPTSKAA
jgi:putative DNA primase/helicase